MLKIDDAPGLQWRPMKNGWEARWRARADLVKKGYTPRNVRLWRGLEVGLIDVDFIRDRCNALQNDMLVWGRGGIPELGAYDGTISGLIRAYQTDPDSSYRKKRYVTRRFYDSLCKAVERDMGDKRIADIDGRALLRWHESFLEKDHLQMGHQCIGMLRGLTKFGWTILKEPDCRELKMLLHDMRFPVGKPRNARLTAEQATAIRAKAREKGLRSIAWAQAFQFECTMRQKDVIGEYVPLAEPGVSEVIDCQWKWLRGIRWEEIDDHMVLRHVTSKRDKEIVVDLNLAPMVVEELGSMARSRFPTSGPVIVSELTGRPWRTQHFRAQWRLCADDCGIPKNVRNMDSRAGAITEALNAGADIEKVRKTATHSDIGMTQRYSRGDDEATADVMKLRAASRKNNTKT